MGDDCEKREIGKLWQLQIIKSYYCSRWRTYNPILKYPYIPRPAPHGLGEFFVVLKFAAKIHKKIELHNT